MTMFICIHSSLNAYNERNEIPLFVFNCDPRGNRFVRAATGDNHAKTC